MDFQTHEYVQDQYPRGLAVLLIGAPKNGKTTLASIFSPQGAKGVLFLDLDRGTDFLPSVNRVIIDCLAPPTRPKLDANGTPVLNPTGTPKMEVIPNLERGAVYSSGRNIGKPMPVYSWAEITDKDAATKTPRWRGLKEMIAKGGFDTIVLDTVNKLNDWYELYTCVKKSRDTMADQEWGDTYKIARTYVMRDIDPLCDFCKSAGVTLILTGHTKPTSESDGVTQRSIDLPDKLATPLHGKMDAIGECKIIKPKRKNSNEPPQFVVSFRAYDEISVGSRLPQLSGKTIESSFQNIYDAITDPSGIKEITIEEDIKPAVTADSTTQAA